MAWPIVDVLIIEGEGASPSYARRNTREADRVAIAADGVRGLEAISLAPRRCSATSCYPAAGVGASPDRASPVPPPAVIMMTPPPRAARTCPSGQALQPDDLLNLVDDRLQSGDPL
jgi:hypothetical protein